MKNIKTIILGLVTLLFINTAFANYDHAPVTVNFVNLTEKSITLQATKVYNASGSGVFSLNQKPLIIPAHTATASTANVINAILPNNRKKRKDRKTFYVTLSVKNTDGSSKEVESFSVYAPLPHKGFANIGLDDKDGWGVFAGDYHITVLHHIDSSSLNHIATIYIVNDLKE